LVLAASVWGGEDFKRSWRATSNGMESVAVMLSDTCLCLDEINEADPQEIGAIVYCIGNGTGRTRINKIGASRQVQRWRLSSKSPKSNPASPLSTAAKRLFLSTTVLPRRLLVVSKSANRPLMSRSDG
jgi:hypothetical protein